MQPAAVKKRRKKWKMAEDKLGSPLPNLRIEVNNDLMEEIEIDGPSGSKESSSASDIVVEEGEISDTQEISTGGDALESVTVTVLGLQQRTNRPVDRERRYENRAGGFITGVDIFGKEEQSKLGERAKRFGLDADKLSPLTEQELDSLYRSVGIDIEEEKNEKLYRLHALHMRGTENMSTEDIFAYFQAYGPASIEWINDFSCNVVWLDDLSAARALVGLSKLVKGLGRKSSIEDVPVVETEIVKDGSEEVVVVLTREEESDDEEMPLAPEIPLQDSDKPADLQDMEDSVVDVSQITIPIPPGKWRVGASHPKAKNILLRFSARSDKKHPHAEKLSEYYKKYGNPNYGGIKGILTESGKRRYRRNEQYPRDRQNQPRSSRNGKDPNNSSKNPWGDLSKEWRNTDVPRSSRQPFNTESKSSNILNRIGSAAPDLDAEDTVETSESSSDEEMSSRSKVPRMRMHADDEEANIEKRRAQRKRKNEEATIRVASTVRNDLRNKLRRDTERPSVNVRLGRDNVYETVEPNISDRRSSQDDRGAMKERLSRKRGHDRDNSDSSRLEYRQSLDSLKLAPKVCSTVWSRLHRKPVDLSQDEEYEVDRRRKNTPESDVSSECDSDDEPIIQLRNSDQGFAGDLRAKLNSKKTVRQKSPLRIEIDNDEYYRLIDSE